MAKGIDVLAIQDAVREKYAAVSSSAAGKFSYATGRAGALLLGYDPVGNPFSLGAIGPGEAVLDVGCGAGFDLIVASRLAGPTGRISGIDLTPEMVERGEKNLSRTGVSNAEILLAGAEAIPYPDSTFDVVISNGALNLSPSKPQSFAEVFRVLKPGGRFQVADIVLKEGLPPDVACSLEAWSE